MTDIKKFYEYLKTISINDTSFFHEKGFSDNTIQKHHLMKTKNYLHDNIFYQMYPEKNEEFFNTYTYIIPGFNEKNEIDYLMIRRRNDFIKKEGEYINKTLFIGDVNRGLGKLYNSHHLLEREKFIFIVESWTDALSIEEIGYSAIAMNRVANCNSVLRPLILKYFEQVKEKIFIIMCDSDDIGTNANKDISKMLKKLDIPFIVYDKYPNTVKDANEWLLLNKEDFKTSMNTFIGKIKD